MRWNYTATLLCILAGNFLVQWALLPEGMPVNLPRGPIGIALVVAIVLLPVCATADLVSWLRRRRGTRIPVAFLALLSIAGLSACQQLPPLQAGGEPRYEGSVVPLGKPVRVGYGPAPGVARARGVQDFDYDFNGRGRARQAATARIVVRPAGDRLSLTCYLDQVDETRMNTAIQMFLDRQGNRSSLSISGADYDRFSRKDQEKATALITQLIDSTWIPYEDRDVVAGDVIQRVSGKRMMLPPESAAEGEWRLRLVGLAAVSGRPGYLARYEGQTEMTAKDVRYVLSVDGFSIIDTASGLPLVADGRVIFRKKSSGELAAVGRFRHTTEFDAPP